MLPADGFICWYPAQYARIMLRALRLPEPPPSPASRRATPLRPHNDPTPRRAAPATPATPQSAATTPRAARSNGSTPRTALSGRGSPERPRTPENAEAATPELSGRRPRETDGLPGPGGDAKWWEDADEPLYCIVATRAVTVGRPCDADDQVRSAEFFFFFLIKSVCCKEKTGRYAEVTVESVFEQLGRSVYEHRAALLHCRYSGHHGQAADDQVPQFRVQSSGLNLCSNALDEVCVAVL